MIINASHTCLKDYSQIRLAQSKLYNVSFLMFC